MELNILFLIYFFGNPKALAQNIEFRKDAF